MRFGPSIILLAVLLLLGATVAQAGDVFTVFTSCPGPGTEGGFGGVSMFTKESPEPSGVQSLYIFAAPRRPGVVMLGTQGAELERAGCPLIFQPAALLPFVTDAEGFANMWGRWPAELPPGFEVLAQAYVIDDSSPTGFYGSDTLVFEFSTPK